MLRIHKSYNTANTIAYFDKALSHEGEYYTEQEIVTHWSGKVAKLLGMEGKQVAREAFHDLISNINPVTKDRLTVRNAKNRRAGFDLTFNVPKSLSIVHSLSDHNEILQAHQLAYQKAMDAVEADMQTQANIGENRFFEDTGSIIFAAFDHFTSRPNEIIRNGQKHYESDPHLHTHVYVPNVTYSRENNRFQALEIGNIHKLANWYESIYHAHLSFELNRLGYQIRRTPDRYEIDNIPQHTIDKFSNRTKHINQIASDKGISDPKAKSELGAKSRHAKAKGLSEEQLYTVWKERLTDIELTKISSCKNNAQNSTQKISAKEAIDKSLAHLLERRSAVPQMRVLSHALSLGYGHLRPDDVIAALNIREDIIRSDIDTISYVTTRTLVREENNLVALAAQGKGKHIAINPNYKIKQAFLNGEQRNAIQTLLKTNDFVSVLKGGAGTGKTSLLTEVKNGVESAGKSFFSVAPSTQATQVLQQKGFNADTIAALLIKSELQEKFKNGVLSVDEAGMIGIEQMTKLLLIAKSQNAQVFLSGDIAQHNSSPNRGDALRILQTKAKVKTARVQKIVRQKPADYRKAVRQLAKGKINDGFNSLDKMGAIKEINDYDERMNRIAGDYVGSISKNRSALVISPTHNEGDLLSEIIRDQLKNQGKIKGKEQRFATLKSLSLTAEQKKDPTHYQPNQIIRFTKNQKGGFKAGSHHEILPAAQKEKINIRDLKSNKIMTLPYKTSQYFELYEKTETKVAQGDLIRLTTNSKTLENTKIANGTRHQVTGFTKNGDIKLSNKKTLSKDSFHFKQGYVETSHSAQGKDAQDIFIAQSDLSFGASSKEQFYVSVSRGTQSVRIYTSDKEELKRNITRSSERITAQSVASRYQKQLHTQKQRQHHRSLNEKLKAHEKNQQRQRPASQKISKTRLFKSER